MKDNTAAVHVQVPVEVTSFLLNEKRTEITKIELKQRVTVLLVPNKNLDTPNYRLERLRQDDPRLENLQASYKMIDEPEEDVAFTRREKAKAKQEPVIKGILPETPAPVAEPKPAPVTVQAKPVAPVAVRHTATGEGGFFAWLKRLFGASAPAQTPARPATAVAGAASAAARGEARAERGGRGGRGGQRGERQERGGRGERTERGPRAERGEHTPGEARDGRARRNERGSRGDRPERKSADVPAATDSGSVDRNEDRTPRPDVAGDGRGEVRSERGTRGPRPEREGRRPRPSQDTAAEGNEATQVASDDTLNGRANNAVEPQDEAQPVRRRGRRGGRGARDRDESRDGENRALADGSGLNEATSSGDAPMQIVPTHALDTPTDGLPTALGDDRPEGRSRGAERDRNRRPRRDEAPQGAGPAESGEASEPVRGFAHETEAQAMPLSMQASLPTVSGRWDSPATVSTPATAPTAVATPTLEAYVLQLDSLQAIAASSGLEWINSDSEKIRAVQEAMAHEPLPVHVPRERKPLVHVDEGPLVLVETRKDLSQIKLPFETAEAA